MNFFLSNDVDNILKNIFAPNIFENARERL